MLGINLFYIGFGIINAGTKVIEGQRTKSNGGKDLPTAGFLPFCTGIILFDLKF
jgi:hypothetical protein